MGLIELKPLLCMHYLVTPNSSIPGIFNLPSSLSFMRLVLVNRYCLPFGSSATNTSVAEFGSWTSTRTPAFVNCDMMFDNSCSTGPSSRSITLVWHGSCRVVFLENVVEALHRGLNVGYAMKE